MLPHNTIILPWAAKICTPLQPQALWDGHARAASTHTDLREQHGLPAVPLRLLVLHVSNVAGPLDLHIPEAEGQGWSTCIQWLEGCAC